VTDIKVPGADHSARQTGTIAEDMTVMTMPDPGR
jgi:hypothetical protein